MGVLLEVDSGTGQESRCAQPLMEGPPRHVLRPLHPGFLRPRDHQEVGLRETACWDPGAPYMVVVGSGDVRRDVEGGPAGDVMKEGGETGLVVMSACVCS